MSKLVAFAAIQGAYNIVSKAEGKYKRALETYGGSQKLEFPNTAYFLPIIYSLTGIKVTDVDSARKPLDFARKLLPPHVKKDCPLPYLGPLLDAGMAALFAEELGLVIEVDRDGKVVFEIAGIQCITGYFADSVNSFDTFADDFSRHVNFSFSLKYGSA